MNKYSVGDKIYFAEEKRPYTIMACDEKFLICTKPFNIQHKVQYTIVDLEDNIRGADNYWKLGGFVDYKYRKECERMLKALHGNCDEQDKPVMISYKNRIELDIVKVVSKIK